MKELSFVARARHAIPEDDVLAADEEIGFSTACPQRIVA